MCCQDYSYRPDRNLILSPTYSLPGSGEKTILIAIISCGGFKSSSIDGLMRKKGRRAVSDPKTGVFGVLAVKKLGAARAAFFVIVAVSISGNQRTAASGGLGDKKSVTG
jgi:hypothetical protein